MSVDARWLGRYVPGPSPLHALDPRTKFVSLAAVSTAVFALPAEGAAVLALLTAAAFRLAGVPLRDLARSLRAYLWLFAFTALLQVLWTPGTPLAGVRLAGLTVTVTREGIRLGATVFLRLAAVIAAATLVSATTSPVRLGAAVGLMLRPLARFGLPAEDAAMAFSVSLQFLPLLAREAHEIREAQLSRGVASRTGGLAARLEGLKALLVPVLVRAVRRSEELAVAMLARGYRTGAPRTSLEPLAFSRGDLAAAAVVAAALALSALAGHVKVL